MPLQFMFESVDGEKTIVPTVSGDYFHVNRELKANGMKPSEVTEFEYQHRLAHRAGQRLGLIDAELTFDGWADTIAEFRPESGDASGEAEATPAP